MYDTPLPDLAAQIRDPRLGRLYAYWLERKRERRYPARRDLDPVDLRYILGHLMLLDVQREPLRFRFRLHGSEITSRVRYDLTGKFLDELPDPTYRDYAVARCEGLVATGEPLVIRRDRTLDGQPWAYEALWLPFAEDGTEITMLLCAMMYQDRQHRLVR
ncbi:MAG TPA: PAS domain-containing protein [Stellaceae bacterium]|jgi:hypothetical protein|nr:PAS domain-containing protein [Stellaceae bacterium]